MNGIEPATYFDPPPLLEGECAECGKPCDGGIGLCEPCLRDAEEAYEADAYDRWRDEGLGNE